MIKLRIKGSYLLGALFYMRNNNTVYSIYIYSPRLESLRCRELTFTLLCETVGLKIGLYSILLLFIDWFSKFSKSNVCVEMGKASIVHRDMQMLYLNCEILKL